ncbi:hypothetical protein [Beijerinckia mobilis]|uniref:hypothetical protein n=1 Tax=Beijerinckia mobilis TaxID=231434 RepID=UPI0012EC529C|nr:hypothetical protein [Beijerinckia mobilis]
MTPGALLAIAMAAVCFYLGAMRQQWLESPWPLKASLIGTVFFLMIAWNLIHASLHAGTATFVTLSFFMLACLILPCAVFLLKVPATAAKQETGQKPIRNSSPKVISQKKSQ